MANDHRPNHTSVKTGRVGSSAAKRGQSGKKMPSDLFNNYYNRMTLSADQLLRSKITKQRVEVPLAAIGVLKRKLSGAQARLNNTRKQLRDLRIIIKTRNLQLRDGKTKFLTPSEIVIYRDKKIQVEAQLVQANEEVKILKSMLKDAINANSAGIRKDIKLVREANFVKQMATSYAKKIIVRFLDEDALREAWVKMSQEDREKHFMSFVKKESPDIHKRLDRHPKLETAVRTLVFEGLKKWYDEPTESAAE